MQNHKLSVKYLSLNIPFTDQFIPTLLAVIIVINDINE
jgi:hypothetical protein